MINTKLILSRIGIGIVSLILKMKRKKEFYASCNFSDTPE